MARILVVDDHAGMVELMRLALYNNGYPDVTVESQSEIALRRLQNDEFDLIISDWDMFPVNGTELYQELRRLDDYATTPFVLLTAHKSTKLVEQFADDQMVRVLSKPFVPEDVLAVLQELLGQ